LTGTQNVEPVIRIDQLTKLFNHRPALKSIDLQVKQGETVVVFGPNGAGKTTLLKILSTVMKPTSGRIVINGFDLKKDADEIRRHIGVVSHHTSLYGNLTACENLEFYACLYDIKDTKQRAMEVATMVGMTTCLHDRVETFSRGMQQRISIARSLLHNPTILLMDEPETGLDQHAVSMLWSLLARGEYTILLTTHSLERGLELADRVIILNRGQIVLNKPAGEIDPKNCRQVYFDLTGRCS
jgi:heme exporter protein A